MSKPKIITTLAAVAVVLGISAVGAGVINAQTATTTQNPMSALVPAIAQKFNLNTADVQSVVDTTMTAQRAEREAQQQQDFANRLSTAVTNGKLTQAQADLITAKAAELKATMESNKTANQSLTQAERKAKMQAQQTALTQWATANNIPEQYLHFVGGGRGHGFGDHGFGRGGPGKNQQAATSTSS